MKEVSTVNHSIPYKPPEKGIKPIVWVCFIFEFEAFLKRFWSSECLAISQGSGVSQMANAGAHYLCNDEG